MANKVFISFRAKDGMRYKEELEKLFRRSEYVIDCSEDKDRRGMSEDTIQKYLYDKLRGTSVTIVLLTPMAVNHHKDINDYDDWMYDEIRFSLEDRENNRTNGLIAVYTPEAEKLIKEVHICEGCANRHPISHLYDIDNLARVNMMNVKPEYKKYKCEDIYDLQMDSYCMLVSLIDFKNKYAELIQNADYKRENLERYKIEKRLKVES